MVTAFKVKVPAKVQNVSECFVRMISSGWQNILLSNLIMAMQYHEPECHAEKKKLFAVFKFRVTVRAPIVRCNCFFHIYCTADLFATNLNGMVL